LNNILSNLVINNGIMKVWGHVNWNASTGTLQSLHHQLEVM
jgi:hypothetical protein